MNSDMKNSETGARKGHPQVSANSGEGRMDSVSRVQESFGHYAQLMRHDWHGKVRRRTRQRGWGK